MEFDPDDIRTFAHRDRSAVQELKSRYWRDFTEQRGAVAAVRIADGLRCQYQSLHPDWPTPEDREADLAVHIRVGEALRQVRPAHDG